MMIRITYSLIVLCLLGWHGNATSQSWKLEKEINGIKVYTSKEEGRALKDLLIKTTLNTNLHELTAALEDFNLQDSWVRNTITSYKLDSISPSSFHFYMATDFPFPAGDRDVVSSYNRSQDPRSGVVTILYEHVNGIKEEIKGRVRMPLLEAKYELTPISDNEVAIEYYLRTDIGGIIPAWIVNLAIAVGPTDTMQALQRVLDSGIYRGVFVEGIEQE